MSTFVCRPNNNAKVPSICPSTWREVNGLVLFLTLPSCFTSSLPLSVFLLQSLSLFSYPGLNEWKEKSTETRLVSSCSTHSMWPRFKSSLGALRAQIGHCYWHLRSFSRYSSLSPSTLRDPLSLYCGSLLVFIFTHSVLSSLVFPPLFFPFCSHGPEQRWWRLRGWVEIAWVR